MARQERPGHWRDIALRVAGRVAPWPLPTDPPKSVDQAIADAQARAEQ